MTPRTRKKWAGRAAGLVALAVAVAACGGGAGTGDEAALDGVPVRAGAFAAAGSDVADGFTVASGSVLLGSPAPTGAQRSLSGVTIPEEGWVALFLVTGDPYEVLDHVLAEAARAGVTAPPRLSEACTDDATVGFECRIHGVSPGYSAPDPRGVSVDLVFARHRARRGEPPASHLLMRFSRVVDSPRPTPARAPAPLTGPPAPPVPDTWPALLGASDTIPPAIALLGPDSELVVEPGSELVAPLAPFSFCLTGGFTGVFAVPGGEPAAVVDGYDRQFREAGFERHTFGEVPDGPPAVLAGAPGAGDLQARAVVNRDGPSFVMLSRCND